MNKKQRNILIKNLLLLTLITILCAIGARFLLKGETLAEHRDKQEQVTTEAESPPIDSTKESLSNENNMNSSNPQESESPASNETSAKGNNALPPKTFEENSLSSIDSDFSKDTENTTSSKSNETSTEETAMSDRVTYQNGFYYESLSDNIKKRITGISYPADDSNAQIHYDDLCYVSVLYYNFHDKEKVGELICNKAIAQDLVEIFYELYQNDYQIEKIHLVDEYNGDDELSMKDNNSSCFNYRTIAGTNKISNHSYGLAIDINPFYNPYVTFKNGTAHCAPEGSDYYADRSQMFAYKIDENDLAYKLFIVHGFTWGGNWNHSKDYQHFEKK